MGRCADLANFGEDEWYFFTPREKKYPNGKRPNRAAVGGFWKATGTDKPVFDGHGRKLGLKKSLVFHTGKPKIGPLKSNWIMHEYCLTEGIAPTATRHSPESNQVRPKTISVWSLSIYEICHVHPVVLYLTLID